MLNNTQREKIVATFNFIFTAIKENCSPSEAITALRAIFDDTVYESNKLALSDLDILDVVEQARRICTHPCPQNRSQGSDYVGQEPGYAVWVEYDAVGERRVMKEPLGLLNLTSSNDNTAAPVTRLDMIRFIGDLVDKELVQLQSGLLEEQRLRLVMLETEHGDLQLAIGLHKQLNTEIEELGELANAGIILKPAVNDLAVLPDKEQVAAWWGIDAVLINAIEKHAVAGSITIHLKSNLPQATWVNMYKMLQDKGIKYTHFKAKQAKASYEKMVILSVSAAEFVQLVSQNAAFSLGNL